MNILWELQSRFRAALGGLVDDSAEIDRLVDMVRPAQDATFGDYQANCAMPLGKHLGRSPREVAADLVARLDVADFCQPPQIAGPGFINLRLRDDRLVRELGRMVADERLGVLPAERPRTYVIDYSAPNVAKPMHVGHIRSTVIGGALDRTLRFLGHRVISDNHVGDWGTQFGMIIYGFKHFVDAAAYRQQPVAELSRLYRLVHKLIDYQEGKRRQPLLGETIVGARKLLAELRALPESADRKAQKDADKALHKAENKAWELENERLLLEARLADVESDPTAMRFLHEHAGIEAAVLAETAKLHSGDAENLLLWKAFVPACMDEIERIYRRLEVRFDVTLGESFYHDRLAGVVADLLARGIAVESEGAICVFVPSQPAPLIVRKQDGAFLYATTDLATIQYRAATWQPDAILYVVDHRQSLHFEQLFATARLWGYDQIELTHIGFGTVLGADGKPYKTRSGDTVGLEGLLDEAVSRALAIVSENNPDQAVADQQSVAEAVGIGALKYADLSQNRSSDYEFSYDKMLAMNGNTATYMQYAHARVNSIFSKAEVDVAALRSQPVEIVIGQPAERALALALVQFSEALQLVAADYRPNYLTNYLFELANRYSSFFEKCHVLRAESAELRHSRLLLCDLTARTLRLGLGLLGIRVVEKM
jgi:arginyl-tRNA synthetase